MNKLLLNLSKISAAMLAAAFLLPAYTALLATTPAPSLVHSRTGTTLADVTAGGSLFEVYYTPANSSPDGKFSMGTYGSTNYVTETEDGWFNIGPTGNTGSTGLATTIGEFDTPAAVRYYRLRGQAQANYQIVLLVKGYLSVSSLYKTTTSTIEVEKWNGTDYEAYSPTISISEINGSHYRQNASLNTTDQFRITFTATTTGTSNNDFLGFSLEVNGATTGIATISEFNFDGSTILNPNRKNIQIFSISGIQVVSSYTDIQISDLPKGIFIVKTEQGRFKIFNAR